MEKIKNVPNHHPVMHNYIALGCADGKKMRKSSP
jgi:hypothetical protein